MRYTKKHMECDNEAHATQSLLWHRRRAVAEMMNRVIPSMDYINDQVNLAWLQEHMEMVDERICAMIGKKSMVLGAGGVRPKNCPKSVQRNVQSPSKEMGPFISSENVRICRRMRGDSGERLPAPRQPVATSLHGPVHSRKSVTLDPTRAQCARRRHE